MDILHRPGRKNPLYAALLKEPDNALFKFTYTLEFSLYVCMTNTSTRKTVLVQARLTLSFLLLNLTFYIHSYTQVISELTICHSLSSYNNLNTNL